MNHETFCDNLGKWRPRDKNQVRLEHDEVTLACASALVHKKIYRLAVFQPLLNFLTSLFPQGIGGLWYSSGWPVHGNSLFIVEILWLKFQDYLNVALNMEIDSCLWWPVLQLLKTCLVIITNNRNAHGTSRVAVTTQTWLWLDSGHFPWHLNTGAVMQLW